MHKENKTYIFTPTLHKSFSSQLFALENVIISASSIIRSSIIRSSIIRSSIIRSSIIRSSIPVLDYPVLDYPVVFWGIFEKKIPSFS